MAWFFRFWLILVSYAVIKGQESCKTLEGLPGFCSHASNCATSTMDDEVRKFLSKLFLTTRSFCLGVIVSTLLILMIPNLIPIILDSNHFGILLQSNHFGLQSFWNPIILESNHFGIHSFWIDFEF